MNKNFITTLALVFVGMYIGFLIGSNISEVKHSNASPDSGHVFQQSRSPAIDSKASLQSSFDGPISDQNNTPGSKNNLALSGLKPLGAGEFNQPVPSNSATPLNGEAQGSVSTRAQQAGKVPNWAGVGNHAGVAEMGSHDALFSDSFADAAVITTMEGSGRDDGLPPTREEGEPELAGIGSKWLTWVAPSNGVAKIQLFKSTFDTVLAVYTGGSFANLSEVATAEALKGHNDRLAIFNAQAGVAYKIAIAGSVTNALENLFLTWQLLPSQTPLTTILKPPPSQTLAEEESAPLSVAYTSGASGMVPLNSESAPNEINGLTNSLFGGAGGTALPQEPQASASSMSYDKPFLPVLSSYEGSHSFEMSNVKGSDEPNIGGIVGGVSYWFCYLPSANGTFLIDTVGSSFDTLLGVFVDNGAKKGFSSLVEFAWDDNSGNGVRTSALQVPVISGGYYCVMIDGKQGSAGNVVFHYRLDTMPAITSIRTQSTDEGQITPPITLTIGDNETPASRLQLMGTSSDQSLVADTSIVFGGTSATRTVTITPTPCRYGTNTITISVRDDAGNISSCNFMLEVRKANHLPITGADPYARTQMFRTYYGKDLGERSIAGTVDEASYWIRYSPPANGTLFLDTIGSSFDTLLGVFVDKRSNTGYSSLIQVAWDDNSGNDAMTSALNVPVTSGVTYYIMVDGKRGATGTVLLHTGVDTEPAISSIETQTMDAGEITAPIPFTIIDRETDANSLQLMGTSSDQSVVTDNSIVFGGTSTNRTLTITPTPYRYGTNTITISVIDGAGNISSSNFRLQVRNHPPSL